MIPRIAKAGTSFKGAALYYLHDKKAQTAERVAWAEAINVPTTDPQRAVAHMIDTATHAEQLKQAAGLTAGRKLQKPVYVYSLAWHPDQQPSMADQIAAARETLSILGLSSHQALIVAHNDTNHPHVHVIVNRVCPTTGKAAVMSNDQLKLSRWAQDYEQRNGQVLCVERVENNAERDKGKWKKHRAETRQQATEWKKATTKQLWDEFRAEAKAAAAVNKPQFSALWQQRTNRIAVRKDEIKQLYKPLWRDMFKRHRQDLKAFDQSVFRRIGFALSQPNGSILQALLDPSATRRQFLKKQEIERVDLSISQTRKIRDASRELHKAWEYDRDQLRKMHDAAFNERLQATREATNAVWKGDAPEIDQSASQAPEIASQGQISLTKTFEQKMRESANAEQFAHDLEQVKAEEERERRKRSRSRDRTGRTLDR